MADGIDLTLLRQLVRRAAECLVDQCTHEKLGKACTDLGLPEPPRENDPGTERSLKKRERVDHSFAGLPDEGLPAVADRMLAGGLPRPLSAADRNAIQDVLWAGRGAIEVPRRTRRNIALNLDLDDVMLKPDRFMVLLDQLWVLDTAFDPWADGRSSRSLRGQIDQHVMRNPDWSAEQLFEELGAIDEAGDARFTRFLEGLASAYVVPDEPAQRRIADTINLHLRQAGAELRETAEDGGYPVFRVVSTRAGRARQPKNIIFASLAKPDIRFRSAIDNDIEIVSNADDVLVYDRPIGADGILWRDLQAWWKDKEGLASDDDARSSLYQRLRDILPDNSPPQRNLFYLYHHIHVDVLPGLPALLPEVWLLWDPKTASWRGRDALLKFRMDFLLLLPHGERVVLEVDGKTHYATGEFADPAKYADGVRSDRDLKLAGYEVFRFGATELQDLESARPLVQQFFTGLFRRFDVKPRSA